MPNPSSTLSRRRRSLRRKRRSVRGGAKRVRSTSPFKSKQPKTSTKESKQPKTSTKESKQPKTSPFKSKQQRTSPLSPSGEKNGSPVSPAEFRSENDLKKHNVILLYSETCPFCMEFDPLWKTLAGEFGPKMSPDHNFVQVGPHMTDSFLQTPLGSSLPPVTGVPTIFVTLGHGDKIEKVDDRSESNLRKKLGQFVKA